VLKAQCWGGKRTRNAPSASDSPAACVSTEVPSTTSSVVAANTSLFFRALMRRYRGRTTSRPPAMMPLMHSTALMPASLAQQELTVESEQDSDVAVCLPNDLYEYVVEALRGSCQPAA
jgi:hypothetical protein